MNELTDRGEIFYAKWEERRKKKWQYVFIHGFIYSGVPLGITMFLWNSRLNIENMHLSHLAGAILIFGIVGIPQGISRFKKHEKIYSGLNDNTDILNGIEILKADKAWQYENLIITIVNEETLVVRNKLFWFDPSDDESQEFNECFDSVVADYLRIKKVPEFEAFSKNYNERVQIVEGSDSTIPLLDKAI